MQQQQEKEHSPRSGEALVTAYSAGQQKTEQKATQGHCCLLSALLRCHIGQVALQSEMSRYSGFGCASEESAAGFANNCNF